MEPVVATLRKLGIRVILYPDDMLIMANSRDKARDHCQCAIYLLTSLGFVLNVEKSMWSPRQQIEFSLDSNAMTISLPSQKLMTMWRTTRCLGEKTQTSLREISQVLGTTVAHPAILPAPLHYRYLESTKSYYLSCDYSFDNPVPLNKDIQSDLRWWIQEASSYNGRPLQKSHWDLTIESDASKQGWGASCQGTNTGGPWTATELLEHINYLEMKATFLALQSSCTARSSVSVLLLNRFVCLLDKHRIATVLQLEARSHSTGCGCSVNIMGKPLSLHVSPICTDPLLLEQASQKENISSDYSSCVAQSNLVPTITEQSGGHPNPLITNPRYFDQSHGTESPISNTGPSSTSRMASFKRSVHAGGLSERVVDLLQKSWRQLTESAYSRASRCSNLAALDLNFRTYQTNGVRVAIPNPEEVVHQ